jgi:hypothetical protein
VIDTHTPIAPYTRETLALVRGWSRSFTDVEIAAKLNWEVSFLRSLARRHEIEFPAAPPASAGSPSSAVAAPHKVGGDVDWSPKTREVKRGGYVVCLSIAQGEVFNVLFKAWCGNEGRLRNSEISARADRSDIPVHIHGIRDRLSRLRIAVTNVKGGSGGYQLDVQA